MLISVFITLVIVAFALLILGCVIRSADGKSEAVGFRVAFNLTALVIFVGLGMSSFNMEENHCFNQINSSSVTGNVTTNVNSVTCTTDVTVDESQGFFFFGMALVCFALNFVYILLYLKEVENGG